MCLWYLLVRQVSKSDNPENLIILKILVQTTVRGQSTKYACGICADIVGGKPPVRPICYRRRKRLPQAYMALN